MAGKIGHEKADDPNEQDGKDRAYAGEVEGQVLIRLEPLREEVEGTLHEADDGSENPDSYRERQEGEESPQEIAPEAVYEATTHSFLGYPPMRGGPPEPTENLVCREILDVFGRAVPGEQ